MKVKDIRTPLAKKYTNYQVHSKGPYPIHLFRKNGELPSWWNRRYRAANFGQYDSEDDKLSESQLENSFSPIEKDKFFSWIEKNLEISKEKRKSVSEKALSFLSEEENYATKPREVLNKIKQSSIAGFAAVELGKKVADTMLTLAENNFSRYARLSEDYIANNTRQFVNTSINQVKGFVGSVGSGAANGMMFGLAGMAIGAVIGGVSNLANNFIETKEAESRFYQSINASKAQSAFSMQRAGLTDGGRGTEN